MSEDAETSLSESGVCSLQTPARDARDVLRFVYCRIAFPTDVPSAVLHLKPSRGFNGSDSLHVATRSVLRCVYQRGCEVYQSSDAVANTHSKRSSVVSVMRNVYERICESPESDLVNKTSARQCAIRILASVYRHVYDSVDLQTAAETSSTDKVEPTCSDACGRAEGVATVQSQLVLKQCAVESLMNQSVSPSTTASTSASSRAVSESFDFVIPRHVSVDQQPSSPPSPAVIALANTTRAQFRKRRTSDGYSCPRESLPSLPSASIKTKMSQDAIGNRRLQMGPPAAKPVGDGKPQMGRPFKLASPKGAAPDCLPVQPKPRAKMLVLVSRRTLDDNLVNTSHLRRIFADQQLEWDEIDGSDENNSDLQDELFKVSNQRFHYPQIFFQDPSGSFTFVGSCPQTREKIVSL